MVITAYTYWQHPEKPQAWKIDSCLFHPALNLIVGKNASGKTRIINTISNLAALLSSNKTPRFSSGNWEIVLQSNRDEIKYLLRIEDFQVIEEKFYKNNELLLERDASGKGKIFAEEVGKKISFQISSSEIATLKKSDSLQHPFLADLTDWANGLRTYHFASDFGKTTLAILMKRPSSGDLSQTATEQPDKSPDQIVALYNEGKKKFGEEYIAHIKEDMAFIGYKLEDISVEPVKEIQSPPLLQDALQGIHITESDLKFKIPQHEISQGMFRAFALLAHLNYLKLCPDPQSCILIDDIGEGLDFDRSTKLIRLIVEKFSPDAPNSKKVQIIMTSNDRFVMNGIPLDYWLLLERIAGGVKIISKTNSPEIFKEFEFTGLNNFDFLASEYFKE